MEYLPLIITARSSNWERFKARRRNQRFLAAQEKIFKRDKYSCRYCGFQSKKYMVVVNHDHNYSNNKSRNLVTCCSLCYPCFFVDQIGKIPQTGGRLIYLPEFSQGDLNHFCRVLFSSMLKDAPYKGKLQTTYISLKDRAKVVDTIFGPDSHDPEVFGQALLDSKLSEKELANPMLAHLRYLPDKKYLKSQILYWKKNIFDQIPL